jgi:hypothetical protein
MPDHPLIGAYLAELARRLPAEAVDELADGLAETYGHHLARGLDRDAAATSAVAEFGATDQVVAAFVHQAPGRRAALALLATGPVLGVCWGGALVLGQAWTWPIPTTMRVVFGLALIAVVAALAAAATSRSSYNRTRLTATASMSLIALDTALVVVALLATPALVWPMAIAIPASLARIGLTARALPRVLAG